MGFTGSPKEIYEAMQSQTELIPFDDKLSSDVAFMEEGAKVLNYQWIYAHSVINKQGTLKSAYPAFLLTLQ